VTAVTSTVAFYLSEDDVLDEDDAFLGYESVKPLELGGEETRPAESAAARGHRRGRARRHRRHRLLQRRGGAE
jgi:hypothetical protein